MLLKSERRQAIQQKLSINVDIDDQTCDLDKLRFVHKQFNTTTKPKIRAISNYSYMQDKAKRIDYNGPVISLKKNGAVKQVRPATTVAKKLDHCESLGPQMDKVMVTPMRRKLGILKTLSNQNDTAIIYKASLLHEKIGRAKRDLVNLESDIEENCRFNIRLKSKYIASLKNVEQHKINNMQKRYDNFKRMLDRKQIVIDEARRAKAKKINNLNDVMDFRKLLVKNKEVIDGSLQLWVVRGKNMLR